MNEYENTFQKVISDFKSDGRYRHFHKIDRLSQELPWAEWSYDGKSKKVINWCSNDYLGMSQDLDVQATLSSVMQKHGTGSGGTRNISGTNSWHERLEARLAELHNKPAALVFTSGYVANQSALSALAKVIPGLVFISDEKNHASMIQGILSTKAVKEIWRHNDLDHLLELCTKHQGSPMVIAFEGLYSMDGDISPINEICDIAEKFNALTYIDEVHAVGLYGATAAGQAEAQGCQHRVDIVEGTLAKSFGLIGGYVAASRSCIDMIRLVSSPFIFTTSLPPYICAAAITSINKVSDNQALRDACFNNGQVIKQKLITKNVPVMSSSTTHIVPVLVGDAALCKIYSDKLLENFNIYLQPIQSPTVPIGLARLRIAPTPYHTLQMITDLVDALSEIFQ